MPTFVAADDVHRRNSVRLLGLEPVAWSRTNCSIRSRRFSTLLTLLSRASRSFSMSLVHKLLTSLMLARNKEGMFDGRSTCSKRSSPRREFIYHSDRGVVEVQGLKQIPGTRFPLLVLPIVTATLHPHSHTFSLTSESHRVVASANDAENIATRRELSFALPRSGSDSKRPQPVPRAHTVVWTPSRPRAILADATMQFGNLSSLRERRAKALVGTEDH